MRETNLAIPQEKWGQREDPGIVWKGLINNVRRIIGDQSSINLKFKNINRSPLCVFGAHEISSTLIPYSDKE